MIELRRTIAVHRVLTSLLMSLVVLSVVEPTLGKEKKRAPKVQDVSFDGDQVDGVARSPEGFYITQKKAVDFLPLYKVRETFDSNIKESVEYLR